MSVLRPALASSALLAGGLAAATPADVEAGVWFFSKSGQDSYFAAGTHGYNEPSDEDAQAATSRVSLRTVPVYRRPAWHERRAYDYYPPVAVPHGNHYDVVPGWYDYSRYGYWD